ncbi:hypothetical protein HMI54_001629 [Coelomomyces lativittatus]|nr:hypothetical protein HMI56_000651 [Coelomomyces lativittatus]KAJ1510387.1 hypothetical protein HMI54_001629 [Coelomomyces lativittatus]KAJ1517781.1 hypothetical protein HMI55_006022 [Coelomomyces lativittatus]
MKVAVIGGGITGLSCAFYLKKYVPWVSSVLLLEKHPTKWGGWIDSEIKMLPNSNQPCLLENGPRALKPSGFAGFLTSSLIQTLGLESKILHLNAHDRYLVFNDSLEKLPTNLSSLISKSRDPTSALHRILSTLFSEPFRWKTYMKSNASSDESITSFFHHHGWDPLLERMFSGLIHGIYAGHPTRLGIQSTFPILKRAESGWLPSVTLGFLPALFKDTREQERRIQDTPMANDPEVLQFWKSLVGSNKLKKSGSKTSSLYTLHQGLSTLVYALVHHLSTMDGVELLLNTTPTQFTFDESTQQWSFRCQPTQPSQTSSSTAPPLVSYDPSSSTVTVDHVFIASPPHTLSTCLPQLKALETQASTVGVIHVVYRTDMLPSTTVALSTTGFGCLAPQVRGPSTDSDLLGIVFPGGQPHHGPGLSVYTVMMGGPYWDALKPVPSEPELQRRALSILSKVLHIPSSLSPVHVATCIQKDCIPQFPPHFHQVLRSLDSIPKLNVIGTWYHQAGVQKGIQSAWEAVWKLKVNSIYT